MAGSRERQEVGKQVGADEMSNGDVSNDDYGFKEFEESAWFIGTLAAVAIVASVVLVTSVLFGMLGGAAK